LSDGEIRLAWRAFEIVGWPFGPIAQLLLLTGARRDEIASAQWAELELDANIWTIAKERSKNGVAHEIPLSGAALRILEALPRIEAGSRPASFVFTTNGRTPPSGFSKARARINAAILEEATATGQEPLTPWTLHDLRRTAASGMAGLGIAPHVVEAVLNHRSGTIKGVAKVYNRYNYATEKRAALEQWARRLAAIVGGKAEDNVVPIRSRCETR
jgi:integrase